MYYHLSAVLAESSSHLLEPMSNNSESTWPGERPARTLTVRRATTSDAAAIRRLAELDSALRPQGASLIAELDGVAVAVYALDERRAVADPFRPTAAIVAALEARARELRGGGGLREGQSAWRTTGLRAAPASSSRRTGVV